MRKILFFAQSAAIGGGSIAPLRIMRKLGKYGYRAKVVFFENGDAVPMFQNNNIETIIEPKMRSFFHVSSEWYSLKTIYRLLWVSIFIPITISVTYKIIREQSPDLIHLNSSGMLGQGIAAKLCKVPIVWHVREPLADGYLGIRKAIISKLIDSISEVVISICPSDARKLKNSEKLHIIYDSVNFNYFDRKIDGSSFRQEFNLNRKEKAIGMFGGIWNAKGTLEFAKAAKIVTQKMNSVKFFIVGYYNKKLSSVIRILLKILKIFGIKSYNQKVKNFVKEQHLENNLIFTGPRTDVPQIMSCMDIIVFPSIVPHSALPVIEAGAMAKPVIASDLGGPKDLVVDGETGILVKPKDPQVLADAIVEVLNNSTKAKTMGEAGYNRAKVLFDEEKNINQIIKLYESLLNPNPIIEKVVT